MPQIYGDAFLDALEPVLAKYRDSRERRQYLELYRAVVLARDLDTCRSILKRERVPTSRLDPRGARAYGLIP